MMKSKPFILKDVSLYITDGVHNSVKDDDNGDYLLLSCKNIKNGQIVISNQERRINKETYDKLIKRTKTAYEDVLITTVGTIGEVAKINDKNPYFDFQRSVGIIKPNKEIIDPDFLKYSLMNERPQIKSLVKGAVQQCLFLTDLKNVKINVPDLLTQKKISKFLLNIDDKIYKNNILNDKLIEEIKAIYKAWFIEFVPFGGVMPKNWKVMKLKDVLEINKRGLAPKYVESGIPVINQRCLRNGVLVEEAVQFHDSAKKYDKDSEYKPYDILVNSMGVGTLGRVSQVGDINEKWLIHSCISVFRAKENVISQFLLGAYFRIKEKEIEKLGDGTTGQTSLNNKNMGNTFDIVVPSQLIQDKISSLFKKMLDEITLNLLQNKKLSELRDSLLPKLMSGEIDLSKLSIKEEY